MWSSINHLNMKNLLFYFPLTNILHRLPLQSYIKDHQEWHVTDYQCSSSRYKCLFEKVYMLCIQGVKYHSVQNTESMSWCFMLETYPIQGHKKFKWSGKLIFEHWGRSRVLKVAGVGEKLSFDILYYCCILPFLINGEIFRISTEDFHLSIEWIVHCNKCQI